MVEIIRTKTRAEGGITPEEKARMDVCLIDGCLKHVKSGGLCSAHYERKRKYGSPTISKTTPGEPLRYFENFVLSFEGDDCLVWPYGKHQQGYGVLYYEGRTVFVHRLACEQAYGPPPSLKHEAAHACGNGHIGCCNPMHISWKTPTENIADKIIHGTMAMGEANGRSKLTVKDVLEIFSIRNSLSLPQIADRYGVSRSAIADIYAGRTWSWLTIDAEFQQ
ncbi:HNH endonuclease [uncultured Roseibium sp.]|uniref:HNH endonuclease n=1 Tax=uncultured Roseibium sp. TaxID=1936171 RepID=UPI00260FD791|nr:HNH endonuclease [uncultured Roseibium sp.]